MKTFFVTLALIPVLSFAQAKAKAGPLAEVRKELAAGEFERALKKADAALKKVTDPKDVAQLQLARGQAFLALGRTEQARAAFATAVQKDPEVELDASKTSPDAVKLLEKARADLPSTLSVKVKGGEANITIDDKDLGPAPLQLQVPGGAHLVEAKSSTGQTARKEVKALPGRKLEIELDLTAAAPPPVAPATKSTADASPEPAYTIPPPPPEPRVAAAPSAGHSKLGLITMVGGAVVAAGGAVCLWQASTQQNRLTNPTQPRLSAADEQSAVSNGKLFQLLGWVGVGVGAAALAAGAVIFALLPGSAASDDDARVGALLGPDGSLWVTVGGHF